MESPRRNDAVPSDKPYNSQSARSSFSDQQSGNETAQDVTSIGGLFKPKKINSESNAHPGTLHGEAENLGVNGKKARLGAVNAPGSSKRSSRVDESEDEGDEEEDELHNGDPDVHHADESRGASLFPVLLPSDDRLQRWDTLIAGCMVFISLFTPFDIGFLKPEINLYMVLNRLLDLLFLMDFILQFNIAVTNRYGRLMKDRPSIREAYFKSWFLIDLVSTVPWDVISMVESITEASGPTLRFLRMLRLFKMLRLLRGNRVFARFESSFAVDYSMLRLFSLMATLCLLCHWIACGWHMMIGLEENTACITMEQPPAKDYETLYAENEAPGIIPQLAQWHCCYNWFDCITLDVHNDDPENDSLIRRYFYSVLWTIGLVFGTETPILPQTDAEGSFAIFATLVAGITYAYLLGAVCSIFTTMTEIQNKFYESMDVLNRFLKEKHIPVKDSKLCSDLRLFYRFEHANRSNLSRILDRLTPTLRGALAWRVHCTWLKRMPLFQRVNLPGPFYSSLADLVETKLFAPLELLIEQQHIADCFYVVERGIILTKSPKPVKTEGDVFGEDAISAWRYNMKRNYQANSFTHGSLYIMKVDLLCELLLRPQYLKVTRRVRRRIMREQARSLIVFFSQTLTSIAQSEPDFHSGCLAVKAALDFVELEHMGPLLEIFSRAHRRHHPNVDVTEDEFISRANIAYEGSMSSTEKISMSLQEALQPFGLQDIADTLVSKEAVDLPTLLNMTAEQLHACGAPMGKAIKFAKARGALSALPLSHRRFTHRRSPIESPHVVRSHTAGCVPAEREHGTLNLSEGFSGINPPPVTPRITSGQALNPQACKSNLVASTHAEPDGTSPPTDLGNISEAGANDDCEGMSTSTGPDSFSAWEARGKSGEGEDGMAHAGRIMQFAAELQPYGLQHLAKHLVIVENMNMDTLKRMTPELLYACGAPMDNAIRFCQRHMFEKEQNLHAILALVESMAQNHSNPVITGWGESVGGSTGKVPLLPPAISETLHLEASAPRDARIIGAERGKEKLASLHPSQPTSSKEPLVSAAQAKGHDSEFHRQRVFSMSSEQLAEESRTPNSTEEARLSRDLLSQMSAQDAAMNRVRVLTTSSVHLDEAAQMRVSASYAAALHRERLFSMSSEQLDDAAQARLDAVYDAAVHREQFFSIASEQDPQHTGVGDAVMRDRE
mmetsp:Transcript_15275/g.29457  ORF Transcript_15275/g.29457 Transcript_15275/m.29457 type:complete len:1182 (+) Transcript_15275:78-3623(+)